ncbi:MAG TPA: hypothetical protein VGM44_20420, partial [Polyangiaceae bacterium]
KSAEISEEDEGWFSFQVDPGTPAPTAAIESAEPEPGSVTAKSAKSPEPERVELAQPARAPILVEAKARAMPFSAEVTPSADHLFDVAPQGVFAEAGTLQGVGSLPAVQKVDAPPPTPTPTPKPKPVQPSVAAAPVVELRAPASPKSTPAKIAQKKPKTEDAVAVALTEASAEPAPVRPVGATQVMAAVSWPEAVTIETASKTASAADQIETRLDTRPPSSRRTLKSKDDMRAPVIAPTSENPARSVEVARIVQSKRRPSWFGWVFTLLLAFAVSYLVVSHFKADVLDLVGHSSNSPASPR